MELREKNQRDCGSGGTNVWGKIMKAKYEYLAKHQFNKGSRDKSTTI